MSAPYNGYSSDYVCVDQAGQTLGAANAQSGTSMYHVEPQGGSFVLPGAKRLLKQMRRGRDTKVVK